MAGDVTIAQRVTDDFDTTTIGTVILQVDPNQPPVAEIIDDDADDMVTVCDTVTFESGPGTSDPDGTITAYKWELFTSGTWETIGSSKTIDYDFKNSGSYQVRLTVTDNDGFTDSDNAYVTIDTSGTGGGGSSQIPEFPTIALPVVSLLAIMLLVSKKK